MLKQSSVLRSFEISSPFLQERLHPFLCIRARAEKTEERRFEELAGFERHLDRKSTRLNSSHSQISYAVFCLNKKTKPTNAINSSAVVKRSKSAISVPSSNPVNVSILRRQRSPATSPRHGSCAGAARIARSNW